MRSRDERVYALRNLLEVFPDASQLCNRQPLTGLLREVLGENAGLVRGLFFDKPPERSWSLPWHKDLTIAVRDNHLAPAQFRHPTRKAGVPHVEAPRCVLESMLTLRIHLDDATEENGALRVMPGSHRLAEVATQHEQVGTLMTARAGDVLAMRRVQFEGSVPFYKATGGNALLSLLDSTLTGAAGTQALAAISNPGLANLRRVTVSGFGMALDDTSKANIDVPAGVAASLERERSATLDEATRTAEDERRRLLARARDEVEAQRSRWRVS